MATNAGYYVLVFWQLVEKFFSHNHVVNINSSVANMISLSTLISTLHALHKLDAVELVSRFIPNDTMSPDDTVSVD